MLPTPVEVVPVPVPVLVLVLEVAVTREPAPVARGRRYCTRRLPTLPKTGSVT